MEKEKFNIFMQFANTALQEIAETITGSGLEMCEPFEFENERKIVIIVGMTGKNKGRILLQAGFGTAEGITEAMNFEPLEDPMDLYLYMAEFSNIFCGRAITFINNEFKGSDIRLAPPVILAGMELDITTPNIQSDFIYYTGQYGKIKIDIGFEGK